MRHQIKGPALVTIAALALVGCSGSTAATASVGTGASAAVVASGAPTTAVTPAASQAAPSEAAAASQAAPSIAIPDFAFPSTDKELEALLPDTLCGAKVRKLSMSGERFATSADPSFVAMLQKVGKSASDVSFAIAAPTASTDACSAGIFRVKGADGGALKEAFLAQAAQDGTKFEVKSIGGKDVYVDKTSDSFQYAYFKGDAIVIAGAPSETVAATVIAVLP